MKKKKKTNNLDTKPLSVFNYSKNLSQKTNNLMDEIEETNKDTDIHKFAFIGRNKENFNFNVFHMPLNFLLNIFNAKTSFKKAEFEQREIEKK